ncbi:conserved exported protein of unknown function [Rhodovastum atsumiense]|uniref:BcpO-related WXXGXW repeat protein n=1 Tax=Rhodovastum atsumiense TaxID=504468 RepID=A0A5M6IJR0_9PROT|nr:YXWGXW repeat-containing protein [Rhodovastum atsumiense]KAA5608504.1 hypothetical protein F1189_28850 [Rhodovastum atsumiense]CAH2599289.1 conserved exported protein of unknown function [Rhodovastum atsumiense]
MRLASLVRRHRPLLAGGMLLLLAGCVSATREVAYNPPYPPPPAVPPEVVPKPPVSEEPLIWQPGHWVWTGTGYNWTAGQWVKRAGHGTQWQDGYWASDSGGWRWVPAHWL